MIDAIIAAMQHATVIDLHQIDVASAKAATFARCKCVAYIYLSMKVAVGNIQSGTTMSGHSNLLFNFLIYIIDDPVLQRWQGVERRLTYARTNLSHIQHMFREL